MTRLAAFSGRDPAHFLNGRDGHYLDKGMETVVAATDVVDIFPAVGGG